MHLMERNKAQTTIFSSGIQMKSMSVPKQCILGCLKGGLSLFFPLPAFLSCLRFLAFHLTPGLSLGGWGSQSVVVVGLKCNPGPVTTKAWPLRAKAQPHFLNCNVIPQQAPRTDCISRDYMAGLSSALTVAKLSSSFLPSVAYNFCHVNSSFVSVSELFLQTN